MGYILFCWKYAPMTYQFPWRMDLLIVSSGGDKQVVSVPKRESGEHEPII